MVSFPNGALASSYTFVPGPVTQSSMQCKRCNFGGCDIQVRDCGCFLHARCTPVLRDSNLTNCPMCGSPARSLLLTPMNFDELDEAKAQAASMSPSLKRGKKRKNATIARLNPGNSSLQEPGDGSDLRTGRWTSEETMYCDKLIDTFEKGHLPISDGVKLNDFLASMLKSKQSRLTKKMKNARLSAKTYTRTTGFMSVFNDAVEFSELERSFSNSIKCNMERAEIRFHMQKEWRELFSTYCVSMGQKLEADSWLSSVEEMDKRVSQAKDAARMARRKVMMGYALSQDSLNQAEGVFIEESAPNDKKNEVLASHASSNSLTGLIGQDKKPRPGHCATSLRGFSSPFVGKVVQYVNRNKLPFEHVDAWVPSFVPNAEPSSAEQQCRLCFAGSATCDTVIPPEGGAPVPISTEHSFDLLSFGEYSAKFSFDVGCGLPGRVYRSSICSWEQGIENAPSHQFERCGGASQWGIKTVLGIPVPSPNVGRIVVLLYSRHDRARDPEMVRRVTEELTKLKPTPKWKLVVDLGIIPQIPKVEKQVDRRTQELLQLLADNSPTQATSPYVMYLPGFTTLRILLTKHARTAHESEMLSTMLESYFSYRSSGRSATETAWMCARDYMLLSQASVSIRQQQQQLPPRQAPQQVHAQMMQQQPPQQQFKAMQQQLHPGAHLQQIRMPAVQQNADVLVMQQSAPMSSKQAKLQQSIPQHQRVSTFQMVQLGAVPSQQPKQGNISPVPAPTQNLVNRGTLQYHNEIAGHQLPMNSRFTHSPSQLISNTPHHHD